MPPAVPGVRWPEPHWSALWAASGARLVASYKSSTQGLSPSEAALRSAVAVVVAPVGIRSCSTNWVTGRAIEVIGVAPHKWMIKNGTATNIFQFVCRRRPPCPIR